jgi:hypothetical protein
MRNQGERVAEILLMVEIDLGDDARRGLRNDIGGIEPAAEADFEQQIVGPMRMRSWKRTRCGDV